MYRWLFCLPRLITGGKTKNIFVKQYLSHDDPCSTILNTIRIHYKLLWGFPDMVGTRSYHPFWWDLPQQKPSIWGTPMAMETSWSLPLRQLKLQLGDQPLQADVPSEIPWNCWVLFVYLGVPWSCLVSLWIGWTLLSIVLLLVWLVLFLVQLYTCIYLHTFIYCMLQRRAKTVVQLHRA